MHDIRDNLVVSSGVCMRVVVQARAFIQVAREVREEAGVEVDNIHILGSQPWPIGRGGSCELMVGCIAKAKDDTLHMDDTEMEEVRWVSRADVSKALERSSAADNNPLTGEPQSIACSLWQAPDRSQV